MSIDNRPLVRFAVQSDEDARKIAALLEALGYETEREMSFEDDAARLECAVERIAKRAKLTEREREVVACVFAGVANGDIATRLDVSRATIKWHMHNIFAKTGTNSARELYSLGLRAAPRD